MTVYSHSFRLSIYREFTSTHRNFGDALTDWTESFYTDDQLRKALLDSDQSTDDILDSVEFHQTDSIYD